MSLIDDQTYLDQDKFRRWIESILSKAAHVTNENNRMRLKDYIVRILYYKIYFNYFYPRLETKIHKFLFISKHFFPAS